MGTCAKPMRRDGSVLQCPAVSCVLNPPRAQEYNMSKRVEHSVKALRHDGSTISAVDPRTYSRRFQDFISKVFV